MSPNLIRIILVEDHAMVRETYKQLFKDISHVEVAGECSNGKDAVNLAKEKNPDIALVDVNMLPVDGFQTTRNISEATPEVKVIGLSMNTHPSYARKMIDSGAKGYITKSSPFPEIIKAIETVHAGEIYICEEVKNRME
mgnify:CR=1 FL=1